jgi:polysaccharide lyase-like protein
MEDGSMSAWYAGGGGGEFNGHPGNLPGSVGNDGSTTAASQERAHSGAWSAKVTIPSNGAARLYRWNEPRQHAELYYSAWFYFPQSYTLGGAGSFWALAQWKSSTPSGAHDPFFLLVAMATPSGLNFGIKWFPLPLEGPLPGQTGYREWLSNIPIPVGRWVHVETRYRSAGDFTGAIQIWVDGVEIHHMEGVRTRYPDGDTQWSITSYAQGLSPAPVVIYVDDVVISQTRVGQ